MIGFLNLALLAGLAAVVIPPIVHLFSRKKYDDVDWAAMQFLQVSPKTRRKVSFDQWLLMLLRMLAIALLVGAFLAPTLTSRYLGTFAAPSGERDFIILIDGSASMAYKHAGKSGTDAAKDWVRDYVGTLNRGDRVAVYEARQQARPLLATLSTDHDQARNALELLSTPRGGVDWPGCVAFALTFLENARPQRDIVIVTDGQRYGWADDSTVAKWELLKPGDRKNPPHLWVVNVAPERPADPANTSLETILAGRGVASAGREVRFKSALRVTGPPGGAAPKSVKLEIDGRATNTIPLAAGADATMYPIVFTHKFTAGSHLVSLMSEPDDLPGDNRQDFALEVLPSVPVLIYDGDPTPNARNRGAEYLKDALAPGRDLTPSFLVKVRPFLEFEAGQLTADLQGVGTSPRVVVFANVPRFTKDQSETIEKYLTEGGSVWITLGDRCDAVAMNRIAFRAGQGWLPARLDSIIGEETNLENAPKPLPASFIHPAMEIFKDPLPGGLHTAYFPRRWKIDTAAGVNGNTGVPIGMLTNGEAFLVERGVGRGRVLLSAIPMDRSWRTNLMTLPDFVRFAHEMAYYLAGAKSAERNLAPGQPILFTPRPYEPPAGITLFAPEAAARNLPARQWPLLIPETKDPGAYRIVTVAGRNFYYAVRSDPLESVLTGATEDDRARVKTIIPTLDYVTKPGDVEATRGEG
ncbi:MAG: BatA domain-containing protein, partial [Gemmataceae bacterium]